MKDFIRTRLCVALFVFTLCALSPAPQASVLGQTKAEKIDQVMSAAHNHRLFHGAVLVAENGKVIYRKGFGMANMEWNISNAPDTKFRLGSITKQFTAVLILQLVEQGKVKLDGTVSAYLPEYRKDIGAKVTVHQLLNHTSGIPSYTSQAGFFRDVSRNPFTVDDFVKKYTSGDLEFEPGSKFAYNNSGYFLLGAIIEKVTGKTYEEALRQMILQPLGMKNTGYDHHQTILEKRATGYAKTINGYSTAPYLDMSIPYAAGSMYSTVDDLFVWDQALYGDKILRPQSRDVMHTPHLNDYAYGWVVTKVKLGSETETAQKIAHGGGINGFSTVISRFPAEKHLIVLLDNTGQNLNPIETALTNILYGKAFNLPKMPVAETVHKTIMEKGIEAGIAHYRELKAKQADSYDFGEPQLNNLGYQLLRTQKVKDAIEIFRLNVEVYPNAFNTYDSLGEAYLENGEVELAIKNYKKSLELNPDNSNATAVLARLAAPPVKVAPTSYEALVGEYEITPAFRVKIFREGDRLMTQATGQQAFELFPESDDQYFLKEVDAKVTFVKNEAGRITSLVIHQNGRNVTGKKL